MKFCRLSLLLLSCSRRTYLVKNAFQQQAQLCPAMKMILRILITTWFVWFVRFEMKLSLLITSKFDDGQRFPKKWGPISRPPRSEAWFFMNWKLRRPPFSSEATSAAFPEWRERSFCLERRSRSQASGRGRWGLEVGDGGEFVPLDRLLAEVKVFESKRDAAQKVVLTQRLSTEHAQLKLTQAQGFLAVATVHQLWRKKK